jgi:hypothetical protein
MGAGEVKRDCSENEQSPGGDLDLASLVLTVVRDVLELPSVCLDDDFFTAGGNSLDAMHVVGRLSHACGLRVRVSHVLAHPVLREFAAFLEQLRGAESLGVEDAVVPLAAALRAASAEGGDDAL